MSDPLDLLALAPIWLSWKREGDYKVPVGLDGQRASSLRPETWANRADARAARRYGHGEGIVLAPTLFGQLCGLDLDGSHLTPLFRCESYGEYSPSGDGVHFLFFMNPLDTDTVRYCLGGQGRKWCPPEGEPAVELHLGKRYFTVTGDRFNQRELNKLSLDDVLRIVKTGTDLYPVRSNRIHRWPDSIGPDVGLDAP